MDDNPAHATHGNVYLTGYYLDASVSKLRYYTVAYNAAGSRIWYATEPVDGTGVPSNNNYAGGMTLSPDGNYVYVAGSSCPVGIVNCPTTVTTGSTYHFYIVRYDVATGLHPQFVTSNFGLSERAIGIAADACRCYIL